MFTYAALIASIAASDVNAVCSAETRRAAVETLDLFDAIDALTVALDFADDCYASDPEATGEFTRFAVAA